MKIPVLEIINICKSFNKIQVLKDVNLVVMPGEIHALRGENGAGKSTLLNIIGGVINDYSGNIKVNGNIIHCKSPLDSKKNKIGFIHQELNIINDLKVYENIFLGREKRNKLGLLNKSEMINDAIDILTQLGCDINPITNSGELEVSKKQIVEIATVLSQNTDLIIMDEPTTALSDNEILILFNVIKKIADKGVSIIFVSHKIKEIIRLCDTYTVLRNGEISGTGKISDINEHHLVKLMIGDEISVNHINKNPDKQYKMMEVKELSLPNKYTDISFDVMSGETIGFTGLSGDGRNELFDTFFGLNKNTCGTITIKNKIMKINNPVKAKQNSISMLARNRKENAIIKDMSVKNNFTISAINQFTIMNIINIKKEKQRFNHYKKSMKINCANSDMSISNLSGGNQQKVMLARWLETDADILIMDNPTQGVDIGAKSDIYNIINNLAHQRKSIIISSNDINELLVICDRIFCMYHGKIVKELLRHEATETEIMKYVSGTN